MMRGEREQCRVEADRIALTLKHGATQVIVKQNPGDPGPCFEGAGMSCQQTVHTCIEEEAQIDLP
jgi:hypothetical protein